jgi:signal transduction histidine kinase/ligand-binding sensor domain-containing protein/CheY-like chemotaxis protein
MKRLSCWCDYAVKFARIGAVLLWLCLDAGASAATNPPKPTLSVQWDRFTTPVFRNLTQDTGLPRSSEITAFGQDGAGFMWFGTESGLMRWDGYTFKTYLPNPKSATALPDAYVVTLHADGRGRLWVGMNVGGVALYDPKRDGFIRYGVKAGLGQVTISAIADDGPDGVWLGGEKGLAHLDTRNGDVRPVLPATAVVALLRDHTGALWLATERALLRRPPGGGAFFPVGLPTTTGESPTPSSLFEDDAGRIWIGTQHDGAYLVAPGALKALPFRALGGARSTHAASGLATQGVVAIVQSSDGRIWMGSAGQGVFVVDPSSMSVRHIQRDLAVPSSLINDSVAAMTRDRSGLIWIATIRGVSLANPNQTGIKMVIGSGSDPKGLDASGVSSLAQMPDGRIWIGRDDHGVEIIDPVLGKVAEIVPNAHDADHALPDGFVHAIALAQGGAVYLGAKQGLYRTTLKAAPVNRVPIANDGSRVRALLVLGHNLWVGHLGLTRIPLGRDGAPSGAFAHIETELPNARIGALAPGPRGSIWVGTHDGLARVNTATMQVIESTRAGSDGDSLARGGVTSLAIDRQGRLWISSTGGAINILTGRDGHGRLQFRHLGVEDGLPNANVDDLQLAPDGTIWASTDDGLARIDPRTLTIKAFRGKDGVYFSDHWSGAGTVTAAGEVIFGSIGGLDVIRPEAVSEWGFHPPIVITDVEEGAKPLSAEAFNRQHPAELRVPPGVRSLRVEFSALDYASPQDNHYAYRLVGYDRDWVQTDYAHRVVAYTNLNPGHYELRLRGSNKDGVWTQASLDIPVEVQPAWSQTPLFRLAIVALCAIAVAGVIFWRTATIRRQQTVLERQVEERTAQLSEQTALALAANAAKSKFLAMMSHELRTPMNGVLGMARALRASALTQKQINQVEIILRSGDGLMTILNDILDISKIEAGKLELEVATFDLIDIGQSVHDLWINAASEKDVALIYEVDPETPRWVLGDPTRVRQIMLNLVSNALKFTQAGQVSLRVARDGSGIRIDVSDTGIGMTPQQRVKLFQSFTQADASTTRRFGGTGLGLSICKQLSELMGGDVSVQSALGEGSTFTVRLPLSAVAPPDAKPFRNEAFEQDPLAGLHILVADDNPTNLAVARAILEAVGADISTAADGLEALESLRSRAFDIVLMDLQMPRMNGGEAVAEIRAGRAGCTTIPVIALTADVMSGANDTLLQFGFDALQPKPIEPGALIDAICSVLDNSRASDAFDRRRGEDHPLAGGDQSWESSWL